MADSLDLVTLVKEAAPLPVRRLSRRVKQWIKERRNRDMPLRDVFSEVYQKRLWGSTEAMDFYSGPGSDDAATAPYCAFVKRFIADHELAAVVDLGCGDFRVGAQIAPACQRYAGVDIVPALIEAHRVRHGSDRVAFACLDVTADPLPPGDLCLIREVFQHLSNGQIQAILARLSIYPYVLVTDIQPADPTGYRINLDKVHGASSRVVHRSFLRLDKPPFNIAKVETVFECDALTFAADRPFGTGFKLRTFLLRN